MAACRKDALLLLLPVVLPFSLVLSAAEEAAAEFAGPDTAAASAVLVAAAATVDTMAPRGWPGLTDGTLPRGPPTLSPACEPTPAAAFCPGLMSAFCPVARLVTLTKPRTTATSTLVFVTVTLKLVPFTTAANIGVSTEKCG